MILKHSLKDGDTIELDPGILDYCDLNEGDTVKVKIDDFKSIGMVSGHFPHLNIQLKKLTPLSTQNEYRRGKAKLNITKIRSKPKNFWAEIRQYFGE
jgi:hypothetical protein